MKSPLIALGLTCFCVSLVRADYNPIALTPGSFTQDIVVEKSAPPPLANYMNVTIDHGTNNTGNTFFESGYIASVPELGLPAHNTTFISHADANHVFRMPPSYVTNNCAFIGADNPPGTTGAANILTQVSDASLNVSDANLYNSISILWGCGGTSPASGVTVVVSHADGTPETFSFTTIDWFNGASTYAWLAGGRVQSDALPMFNTLRTTSQTKLFSSDFALSDTSSAVTNVAFTYAGTTANAYRLCVFAVSGSTDGLHYNPVAALSGFNKDAVVEAGAPNNYIQGCNVTMDNGAFNTVNTFYEQGFANVQGGSSPFNVGGDRTPTGTTGLPHPGATITSGNYSFTMPATYAGNDCVFIGNYVAGITNSITNSDGSLSTATYTNGSFTLSSPQAGYTGFSILNSAGNGPCGMIYTIHYSDGNTDSGTIYSTNWFTASPLSVFNAGGRVDVSGIALNNVGGSPAGLLFHTDITTGTHSASTATNILSLG